MWLDSLVKLERKREDDVIPAEHSPVQKTSVQEWCFHLNVHWDPLFCVSLAMSLWRAARFSKNTHIEERSNSLQMRSDAKVSSGGSKNWKWNNCIWPADRNNPEGWKEWRKYIHFKGIWKVKERKKIGKSNFRIKYHQPLPLRKKLS